VYWLFRFGLVTAGVEVDFVGDEEDGWGFEFGSYGSRFRIGERV
jgi:hypothetical protein